MHTSLDKQEGGDEHGTHPLPTHKYKEALDAAT